MFPVFPSVFLCLNLAEDSFQALNGLLSWCKAQALPRTGCSGRRHQLLGRRRYPKRASFVYARLVAEEELWLCWCGGCSGRQRDAQSLHVHLLLIKVISLFGLSHHQSISLGKKTVLPPSLSSSGQVFPSGYQQEQVMHLLEVELLVKAFSGSHSPSTDSCQPE